MSTAEILVPFLFNTICLAFFFWNAYQCDPGVIRTSREDKLQVLYTETYLCSLIPVAAVNFCYSMVLYGLQNLILLFSDVLWYCLKCAAQLCHCCTIASSSLLACLCGSLVKHLWCTLSLPYLTLPAGWGAVKTAPQR